MKNASSPPPCIVWFYHDLRLSDNVALTWAVSRGEGVIPLYIHDLSSNEGGASKWWLYHALANLGSDIADCGTALILRQGKSLDILRQVLAETGARSVTWTQRYEPELAARDAQIIDALEKEGIEIVLHPGFLLFDPEKIKTGGGTPFKVFTPFSKACFAAPAPTRTLPAPKKIKGITGIKNDDLNTWKLIPRTARWVKGLGDDWRVGEKAAARQLQYFIKNNLMAYKTGRDRPDIAGTSRLSPYLHFGHISPRQAWHAIHQAQDAVPACSTSSHRYLLEILWREFSWHLLCAIPDFTTKPLQKSFMDFPWIDDEVGLKAWQRGLTGYPVVDAGMRELWQTGWMHNRVRMIVASFLIKDLLVDWRKGMAWFWDTLVDADLGSNTASWQWVAGCGADASPYFRIFNPTLQGEKFDPHGDYVRRFVPELANMDTKFIHEPWKAPPDALIKAGVVLGKTYPKPMVDHAAARERALKALKVSKGEDQKAPELGDLFD